MSHATRARFALLLAALLFSTGGAAIKATTLSSWQVASFRSGIAALFLCAAFPAARRHWTWWTFAVGAAYAGCLVLFVLGTKLTTAANTIFLQSTAPLYVALLAPWILQEPTHRRDVGYMALLSVGLLLLLLGTDAPSRTAPSPAIGNIVAAVSGVMWALTLIGLRAMAARSTSRVDTSGAAIVCGNVIACVACLPLALRSPGAIGGVDIVTIAYLGSVQIGLAYVLLNHAVRYVPALETALLLLLEPVLNPVWAWIVHEERPGWWSLVGGAVILLATTLQAMAAGRSRQLS